MVEAAGTVADRRESATALDRLAVGASPTRHANARSELTRIRLTETAEELFAERGLQAVSLRDVCAAAGQRNHSAAQYHFGSRLGLVVAVFEHRMHAVNDRRHALLDVAADGDVEALVDAVVRPLPRADPLGPADQRFARRAADVYEP